MNQFIVKVKKTACPSSCIGDCSDKESMKIAIKFSETSSSLVNLIEKSYWGVASIKSIALICFALLKHNGSHFYKVYGLGNCVSD